jgi:hypothetical protein
MSTIKPYQATPSLKTNSSSPYFSGRIPSPTPSFLKEVETKMLDGFEREDAELMVKGDRAFLSQQTPKLTVPAHQSSRLRETTAQLIQPTVDSLELSQPGEVSSSALRRERELKAKARELAGLPKRGRGRPAKDPNKLTQSAIMKQNAKKRAENGEPKRLTGNKGLFKKPYDECCIKTKHQRENLRQGQSPEEDFPKYRRGSTPENTISHYAEKFGDKFIWTGKSLSRTI